MFIIENYPYWNPYQHTPNDTLETINLEFHNKVTRSLVAAIASMAGVVPNEEDIDNDGIPNNDDNCPEDHNPDQQDTDDDGIGDVCDTEPTTSSSSTTSLDPVTSSTSSSSFERTYPIKVTLKMCSATDSLPEPRN